MIRQLSIPVGANCRFSRGEHSATIVTFDSQEDPQLFDKRTAAVLALGEGILADYKNAIGPAIDLVMKQSRFSPLLRDALIAEKYTTEERSID